MKTKTRTGAATLADVARQAGVSLTTASTVLNKPRSNTRVSDATRERIVRAAAELRYHPNAHARSLLGHKTQTLGVLFGLERATVTVSNPYAITVLQGIIAGAAEAGYNVTLFTEPWHDASRSAAPFRDRRTDGIIVIAPATNSDILPTLRELGILCVSVSTSGEEGDAPAVDVDNAAGARLATEYLLSLGHTRIAHLMGDACLRSARQRRDAFLAAMQRAGIAVPDDGVVPGLYVTESGYERAQALLARPEPPTAVFAASDEIARGVLKAARDRGVAVPESLSVVGFDGIPPADPNAPPLTTVRQPLVEIGTEAARILLRLIEGEPAPDAPRLFAPELIVGASTSEVGQ